MRFASPFRIITGSASRSEKAPTLIKPKFSKKGVGKFSTFQQKLKKNVEK